MRNSICQSCQSILRLRFQRRVSILQNARRNKSTSNPPIQSWYWDTQPPNDRQLASAAWFFRNHPPRLLWTAKEWLKRRRDESISDLIPEVVFLGRSNIGKSSLLNALVEDPDLNRTGSRPGLTTVLRAFGLSTDGEGDRKRSLPPNARPGQLLTVIDAPGYGHASRTEWGAEIVKYLQERKNLRRVFLLLDAMHGAKPADLKMLGLLQENAISHQIIATKCDRFEPPSKRQELLNQAMARIHQSVSLQNPRSTFTSLGEMIAVGCLGSGKSGVNISSDQMRGVSAVQFAVLRSVGLDDYAYGLYKDLEEAQKFDDSPMKPTPMWKPTPQIDTLSETDPIHSLTMSSGSIAKSIPAPRTQKMSPSSIPEALQTCTPPISDLTTSQASNVGSTQTSESAATRTPTTQAVSRGFSAFLDAVTDSRSPASAKQKVVSKPGRYGNRNKFTGKLVKTHRPLKYLDNSEGSYRPVNDVRTRVQDLLPSSPKVSHRPSKDIPKNMQDLLAISESRTKSRTKKDWIGSTAENRTRSRHANPFCT